MLIVREVSPLPGVNASFIQKEEKKVWHKKYFIII